MDNEFNFQIQLKNNYILIELKGKISSDILMQVSRQLQDCSDYKPGMNEIWDITYADLSDVDPDSLLKAAEALKELWDGFKRSKVGIVSGKLINMGHINLFGELYQRDDIQAFETLAKAEKWIFE